MGYELQKHFTVNDLDFARILSSKLVTDLQLDPNAVFASGHSNGGDMCYFLAIQTDPILRAIAPMAGTMMVSWGKYFPQKQKLSIIAIHGTADEITPFSGDFNDTYFGPYYGSKTVVGDWAKRHSLEHYEITNISSP